jgi:hypothetical protein
MRKFFIVLGCIQLITAIGAIPAGALFVFDPSGAMMGNSVDMLSGSPFDSFLIPGLFLLIINGFGSLAGTILSFRQNEMAGIAAIALGVIMCFWIIIQVLIITLSSFLQPVFFITGLAEIILGLIIIRNKKRSV